MSDQDMDPNSPAQAEDVPNNTEQETLQQEVPAEDTTSSESEPAQSSQEAAPQEEEPEDETSDAGNSAPAAASMPAPAQIKQILDQEDTAVAQDIAQGHIKPETYEDLFANKSTLGKIGTIFGLMIGGAGAGLSHQPNALLDMMNKELERDFEAQKASNVNAQNWLRISQQSALNKADIAYKQALQSKIPSEIAMAQANKKLAENHAAYLGSQTGLNNARIATSHMLQRKLDQMPPGQSQMIGQNLLDNTINPAIAAKNSENNQKTAGLIGLSSALNGGTAQAAPAVPQDTGIDFNRFNLQKMLGQNQAALGMPGGMQSGDDANATKEAEKVQDNRAMLNNFLDSYDKLDKMAFAGKLTKDARAAEISTMSAAIARETAGRFNQQEAEQQMMGMFPNAGDWKSTRIEKRNKAIDYFNSQEAGTPTLDRFQLKTPFPMAKVQAPDGKTRWMGRQQAEQLIKNKPGGKIIQ